MSTIAKPPTETLEEKFNLLADSWQNAVAHLSSSSKRDNHPAYREIIEMGPPVVALLLRDLERTNRHWFTALSAITKANPIAPEDAGDVRKMAQGWLNWGKQQGYQW